VKSLTALNIYAERLHVIQTEIRLACERLGRSPADVHIIGVTKTVDATATAPLLDAGVHHFGENRWQHAQTMLASERASEATWHFIGHLQSNKVKHIVPHFTWCHSIDSLHLARALSRFAQESEVTIRGLIQVNVARESAKSGISPEAVWDLFKEVQTLPNLEVRGFMTMAPRFDSPEATRPIFRGLRQILQEVQAKTGDERICELSMGMSDDYLVAVEEGATMVRIGRRLMGDIRVEDSTG
jgi:PLP dependent protein